MSAGIAASRETEAAAAGSPIVDAIYDRCDDRAGGERTALTSRTGWTPKRPSTLPCDFREHHQQPAPRGGTPGTGAATEAANRNDRQVSGDAHLRQTGATRRGCRHSLDFSPDPTDAGGNCACPARNR